MKKGILNTESYHIHVQTTNEWSKLWCHIEGKVNGVVNKEIGKKYRTTDAKTEKLIKTYLKNNNI